MLLREQGLNTVCEEARCPNLGDCFSRGTATFMLLGDRCTRRCGYCSVATARPQPPDAGEPDRVAEAAARLGLRYVVLTAVARDDLDDGGASHFAAAVRAVRRRRPGARVEVLVPDFRGERPALESVLGAGPDVFNHNIETVPRLFPRVRPQGGYSRSLAMLGMARALRPAQAVKSGLMVGLGETDDEIASVLGDLRAAGVDIVTIGQYLQPHERRLPIEKYYTPEEFESLKLEGEALGFSRVESAPLVRSSYHARRALQ